MNQEMAVHPQSFSHMYPDGVDRTAAAGFWVVWSLWRAVERSGHI